MYARSAEQSSALLKTPPHPSFDGFLITDPQSGLALLGYVVAVQLPFSFRSGWGNYSGTKLETSPVVNRGVRL